MVLFLISLLASTTSIFSLIPQIYRTYRTRSADDLSMLMLTNFLICSLSWIAYGVLTRMWTIVITNTLMTVFSLVLIVFKVRFTSRRVEEPVS